MLAQLRPIFLLFVATALSGCLDVDLKVKVHSDGSGTINMQYAMPFMLLQEYGGKYINMEQNHLLPRTRAEATEAWGRLSGVNIESFSSADHRDDNPERMVQKWAGYRLIQTRLTFKRLEALDTGHFKFSWFTDGKNRYLVFYIHKSMLDDSIRLAYGGMGFMMAQVTEGHKVRYTFDLPGKIVAGNFTGQTGRNEAYWDIPLQALVNSVQQEIIGWVQLPPREGDGLRGLGQKLEDLLSDTSWRKPENLPSYFLLPLHEPVESK